MSADANQEGQSPPEVKKEDAAEENKGMPTLEELNADFAKFQINNVLAPAIRQNYRAGAATMTVGVMDNVMEAMLQAIRAIPLHAERIEAGPAPPGGLARPGIKIFLHARPGDPVPAEEGIQQRHVKKHKKK